MTIDPLSAKMAVYHRAIFREFRRLAAGTHHGRLPGGLPWVLGIMSVSVARTARETRATSCEQRQLCGQVATVSFFPLDPPEDENETVESVAAPWWKPSDGELAVIFPIGETIARNDKVALILTMARVYSNGVELIIDRRIRRGRATRLEWQEMQSAIHNHFARYDPDRVRYGVVLGDGQQLISDLAPGMYGVTPEKHSLNPSGGNGGGGEDIYRFDDGMWLWPLPPEGPLEVVVQWPAFDIPESHVVLDTAPLLARASEARPVWGSD